MSVSGSISADSSSVRVGSTSTSGILSWTVASDRTSLVLSSNVFKGSNEAQATSTLLSLTT